MFLPMAGQGAARFDRAVPAAPWSATMRDMQHTQAARIAVAICSAGRPDILREALPHLAAQTRAPDRILFVVPSEADMPFDPASALPRAERVIAPKGLPRQRNAALDLVGDCDAILFLDDDFVPSPDTVAGVLAAFARWPDVGGMTGHLIADGIGGAGFSDAEAASRVADHVPPPGRPRVLRDRLAGLYGCNMAYRMSAIGTQRFDEALPLYAWQEDTDFAARIDGRRIKTDAFAGVHRGAKAGRETSGRRLGYSQIANPWYLWRKGTMRAGFALNLALRNLAANHARSFRPEPWIDRRARAAGNRRALWEVATGRAAPDRILSL